MNIRKLTITALLGIVLIAFLYAMVTYQRNTQSVQDEKVSQQDGRLVRMHSPIFGPQDARVTIVEFFDPACETCRAFYPIVKDVMGRHPGAVRLVLRYAPLHQGSDQVIALLEAAKRQSKYWEVLEAVLAAQPSWADHSSPNLAAAYKAAENTGLDLQKALTDAATPAIAAVLQQDVDDLRALGVSKTPTFFVNGRSLPSFGPDQLAELVAQEVAKAKK